MREKHYNHRKLSPVVQREKTPRVLVINSPDDKGEGPRDERLRLSGPLGPKMANEQGIHEPLQSMIYDARGARFIAEPKFLHKLSRQGRTKVPSSTGSRRSHVAAFTSIGTRSGPSAGSGGRGRGGGLRVPVLSTGSASETALLSLRGAPANT